MKKTTQHIIILIALGCLMNVSGFAQNCSKQDKILKACITLVDSVALEHKSLDGSLRSMYKFTVHKLIYGEYDCKFIYVTTYEGDQDIYQFNPQKNTGVQYWWGLNNTGDKHEDIPIYRHSGNF